MNHPRIIVAALSLSLAAGVGLWNQEGWTEDAVVPVKGDVPTVGPGLTKRPDGSPVQMGDKIKPLEGINRSLAHIQKSELALKRCVTAPLSQVEYDLMVDFAYQYGESTLCRSSMVKRANAADYKGSCEAYLLYRNVAGYDCSTLVGELPNKRCWGVWTRTQQRHAKCMGAQ